MIDKLKDVSNQIMTIKLIQHSNTKKLLNKIERKKFYKKESSKNKKDKFYIKTSFKYKKMKRKSNWIKTKQIEKI